MYTVRPDLTSNSPERFNFMIKLAFVNLFRIRQSIRPRCVFLVNSTFFVMKGNLLCPIFLHKQDVQVQWILT